MTTIKLAAAVAVMALVAFVFGDQISIQSIVAYLETLHP